MFRNVARKGFFNRLQVAGVHPTVAAFIALANYPDKNEPLDRPPILGKHQVWGYTEQFIDKGSLTLDELYERLFGCSVEEYFKMAQLA